MLLEEGSILILHPHDECPHYDELYRKVVNYQHGNVSVGKEECSVAFVFRVVSKYGQFKISDNSMIISDNVISHDVKKYEQMDFLYNQFDIDSYHKLLLMKFGNLI